MCLHWFILLLTVLSVSVDAKEKVQSRKLTTTFLCPPDATECPSTSKGNFVNVAYTKAVGQKDTLHYVISSVGSPAILVARTTLNATLNINWDKMLQQSSEAIKFSEDPNYVYAVIMNRVLEYDDVDDHANLNDVSQNITSWNITKFSELVWSNSSLTSDTDQHIISLKVDTDKGLSFTNNGSLELRFVVYATEGRDDELPHLAYTKDSAQVDFILDHVKTSFSNSRFGLEMAFVTSLGKNPTVMEIAKTKSIDDEHTPGVFELIDWVSHTNHTTQSYVQWKPICYTLPKRAINAITKAKEYDIKHNITKSDLDYNLAFMYFGDKMYSSDVALSMTNVSFGLAKDKFYNHNKYNVWTAGIGKGQPPQDTVSTTIIIIILCGVGIPVALIIFGGIAVCIKKRRNRHKGYEDLSENDVAVNT